MISICPSRRWTGNIKWFIAPTHRIWCSTWSNNKLTLHHLKKDGKTKDIFILGHKPNRFHYSYSQPCSHHHMICLVEPTLGGGHLCITSTEPLAKPMHPPTCFLDVLQSWGNTWLWEQHLTVTGSISWLSESIAQITLLAVTDLSRNQKSSNQNLFYQVMSTRSGSTLVLCIPINFYS